MSIKRSFTVKITFKEGYGEPITLTGKDATAFNTAWHNKLNDQEIPCKTTYKLLTVLLGSIP